MNIGKMYNKGDIVFLKSECGNISHDNVPINKLCMIVGTVKHDLLYRLNNNWVEGVSILIEKHVGNSIGNRYVDIDDIVLFKPEFQTGK